MQMEQVPQTDTSGDGLTVRFSSAPLGVRGAIKQIDRWLQRCGVEEPDRGNAEIVLAEALNNISEHSYGEDAVGEVEVTVVQQGQELLLMIADEGRAMPKSLYPKLQSTIESPDPRELAEGGFGWFLIQQLTQDISYHREGATNRLSLSLTLGNGG